MPKTAAQKDIEKRLDILERTVKQKDTEIADLKSSLRATEKNFVDELNKRDLTITDLFNKIDDMKASLPPLDATISEVPDETEESAETTKIEHDLLIIGDSLVRGLDASNINPGGDTSIECIPGARPVDVVQKFRELCKTATYKRIVVHAGTNLAPKYSCISVADKITEGLETIRQLSPLSRVAFSTVLPKEGYHLLPGINEVNCRVIRSGQCGHFRSRYGFVDHRDFFVDRSGLVNHRLFGRDSTHLTDLGMRAFENSLKRICKI